MASLRRTVDPTLEPVALQEFLDQARITNVREGTLIEGYITTARVAAEEQNGVALVQQTWELTLDRWPCATRHNPFASIIVPRPPLQSISNITYTNSAGASTVMPSSDYQVDIKSMPGRVAPGYNKTWPTLRGGDLNPISVTFVAGYGGAGSTAITSAAAVPKLYKQAISMHAAYLFQVRDENAPMPEAVENLLHLADPGMYRTYHSDER